MPTRITYDCTTGETVEEAMTGDELASHETLVAEALALEAAAADAEAGRLATADALDAAADAGNVAELGRLIAHGIRNGWVGR